MSSWLVRRATALLDRGPDRRSFLVNSAVVGSALVAAPKQYVLRPGSAYQAVCGSTACPESGTCCDGYTEFCCHLYGENRCPPGSILAGWWKADGSGFCDVGGQSKPRYYMDCNARCESGCGCGSSGVCSASCYDSTCGCVGCNCSRRKYCCTRFRYGQCNQHVACVGAIICRVVTCTPPWLYSSACTSATLTDNTTRRHDRPCLHERPAPRHEGANIGVRRPDSNIWYLRDSVSGGPATATFGYGGVTDVPVMGDWNGDGTKTPGIVRDGRYWFLRNSNSSGKADIVFTYGQPGDIPVVGDWNGDGRDSPGVVRGATWLLRNSTSSGPADISFAFGRPGDVPVAGDWTGGGKTLPGMVRDGRYWFLRNALAGGNADTQFAYGEVGDTPIVGDWNADGRSTPGVVRNGRHWYLRNQASGGPAHTDFAYGRTGDIPLTW